MERLLLRPSEAAEAIGVGRSVIYALIQRGELRAVRVGTSLHIAVDELRRWVEEKREERPPVVR